MDSDDAIVDYVGDEPLVSPTKADENDTPVVYRIKKPKRSIVVEPFLCIFIVTAFPMFLLNRLYINLRFQEYALNHYDIYKDNLTSTSCGDEQNVSTLVLDAREMAKSLNADYNIYSALCVNIPSLLTTLFLGAYSDKAGRRYAIILPSLFFLLASIIYLVVYCVNPPVWYLLIGDFAIGLGGSYEMALAGSFAYIADTVEPEKRMVRITIIELVNYFLGSLGPILIGFATQRGYFIIPMCCIVSGYTLMCIYAIFFIPETVVNESGSKPKLFTFSHLLATLTLFTKDSEEGGRRWKLLTLIMSFVFTAIVILGGFTFFTLYQLNEPLCWSDQTIGIFSAVSISVGMIFGIALVKILKCWLTDVHIIIFAGLFGVIHYVYQFFVKNPYMMYITPILASEERLFIPGIRAIMSSLVLPQEQGSVFSAIAIMEVLSDLVGNAGLNAIYEQTENINPGIVFLPMAAFMAISTAIMIFYNAKLYLETKSRFQDTASE